MDEPVSCGIFSFKDTDGLTFESAYGMLCMKLAFAFQDYQFLLDDDAISDDDKGIFKRILGRTASMDETKAAFAVDPDAGNPFQKVGGRHSG